MIRLPSDLTEAVGQGRTVVVPSRQRSEAVRLAYAADALASGRTVWATPDVLPLDTWLSREIERRSATGERLPRLLTPAEHWLLWRQCTSQLTDSLDLVARGPLAEALRQASELAHEFHLDIWAGLFSPASEGRLLYDVDRAVTARLEAMGAVTASELAGRLACVGGARDVLLAGFERLTPRLDALITSRGAGGCATHFRRSPGFTSGVPHARAVLATDASEELERIADWSRERLAVQPDARLLVLMPGAPEARERLVTLIRQSIDPAAAISAPLGDDGTSTIAAIEGGSPFSRNPFAAHGLQTLTWLTRSAEFADFSAWLSSPYWQVSEGGRARLDLWLRERAPLEIDPRGLLGALDAVPESLRSVARELSALINQALRQLSGSSASPRDWSQKFTDVLTTFGILGREVVRRRQLSSAEVQTHDRFVELLDDFGGLTPSMPSMSRDTAVQWLNELANRASFRPASGDALVTISSQLTDPIVQYDGIWVTGLHADVWPAPVQADPFLPLDAQIKAGVPAASAAARAAEARTLMSAWAAATSELVISSPTRADDVQLSPSPLVMHFVSSTQKSGVAPNLWLPQRLRRRGLTEMVDDSAGMTWDVAHSLPSGTRSVELQNLCPFRAYAELRLGSSQLEAPEPGVAPDVRGKLLHTALEKVWKILRGSDALAGYSDDSLLALIERCVEEAAVETMGPVTQESRSRAEQRECRRAVRLIYTLCNLERTRSPFVVREMEHDSTLSLAGAQLRLRIDRLDELRTGGLAILDYKSGRPITGDWYSERPSHPQLLAYLAAVGRETVAMSTISVTAREVRFDGVAAQSGLLPKVRGVESPAGEPQDEAWAIRQVEWEARVERLVQDFLEGRAAVDPRPKACEYCHVVSVCRISDDGADAVDRNIGEADWITPPR